MYFVFRVHEMLSTLKKTDMTYGYTFNALYPTLVVSIGRESNHAWLC
jgi:hypothetical protein